MNKKSVVLMVVGGGCFLAFAFCVLAALGYYVIGGSSQEWLSDEPNLDDISVELNDVIGTKVGEPFILEIDVINTGGAVRNLDSIDIESKYLDGVRVDRVEPVYQSFDRVDFMTEDFSTYDFQRDIAANSTETIKFYMTATKAGNYFGWVDICIDSAVDCNRYDAMIGVEE